MEYIEELACNISKIPHTLLGHSKKTEELIEAVNSLLGNPSTFLTASPSWEWYTKIQREYLRQLAREHGDVGNPIPDPRFPLEGDIDISDNEGPWSERLILAFDGGGVRALSSLLILKSIMRRIRVLELDHPDGPAYSSSSYPWMGQRNDLPSGPIESHRVDDFLPCHYFDYMAGTSTGGQPRVFHEKSTLFLPRAKYSAVKAREAFKRTIENSTASDSNFSADTEIFRYREDRTRTMAISWCVKGNMESEHTWRSYKSKSLDFVYASDPVTIWQVARATSATPRYLNPIEINGAKFLDGGRVANNPSFMALRDISFQHPQTPAVFVSLGTGQVRLIRSKRISRSDARTRGFFQRYTPELLRTVELPNITNTERETEKWLELANQMGLEQAYRLDVEGDLYKFPFDDWRPAGTGQTTIREITDITDEYLDNNAVRDIIDHIAKEAVRIRRARAKTVRWEDFAIDVNYTCPFCQDSHCYEVRRDLRDHLKDSHADRGMSDGEIGTALNEGRKYIGKDPAGV
ncbi:acyl transferase/acyl hydrolase/lysophospholipase [Fusarium oxysporum]|nr:acyl transferase/acyl hydrolase/lysophospholipase [Fusarium oxysporum]